LHPDIHLTLPFIDLGVPIGDRPTQASSLCLDKSSSSAVPVGSANRFGDASATGSTGARERRGNDHVSDRCHSQHAICGRGAQDAQAESWTSWTWSALSARVRAASTLLSSPAPAPAPAENAPSVAYSFSQIHHFVFVLGFPLSTSPHLYSLRRLWSARLSSWNYLVRGSSGRCYYYYEPTRAAHMDWSE
jgi:hypothetical protein